jgi:hypothetical protein
MNFGRLLAILEKSGHILVHAYVTPCAPPHEAYGCHDELVSLGYPCLAGKMCQNFLFARF